MPRPLLSYKQALAWLYGLQRFGIKLGLENIRRLLDELSRSGGFQAAVGDLPPSQSYGVPREIALPSKVIHVAGTNGKGSVCAMIDSICRAQGYRTGLFISPHLVTFRERIRVNGEMISEDAVADGLTMIRDLVADWDPHPTFFEVTTALALKHFGDPENAELNMTAFNSRLIAISSMLLSLKPAWVADSMRPTLFNPMFQSLLRSLSIMKSGSDTHWLRSPVKKQELSNQEFRSFPRRSNRKPKKSFARELLNAVRQCNS